LISGDQNDRDGFADTPFDHNDDNFSDRDENSKTIEPYKEPKDSLSMDDFKKTINFINSKKGVHIDTIVNLIFEGNPTDIKSHYKAYISNYKDYLLNKNTECFDENQNLVKDLKVIPCYKK
jgi:hypothetical protein